jgi:hypothetical protein
MALMLPVEITDRRDRIGSFDRSGEPSKHIHRKAIQRSSLAASFAK